MKTALVCGAGGFIGTHLVKRLKAEGYWVRGVDLKYPEYSTTEADDFVQGDLRDPVICRKIVCASEDSSKPFDEIYQLAADMGGAGFIFTGENDADIMHNSATINLNMLDAIHKLGEQTNTLGQTQVFYSSSACMYPERNQMDEDNPNCAEDSAYPADPDSEYGWEKLFSERLYFAYNRNYKIPIRVARLHNIFGPLGTWDGGREKAPAAICRKVVKAEDGSIEIWGAGTQTRSFLYVDECVEGIRRLMNCSTFQGPVNIGSDEMVSINQLVDYVCEISGKSLTKNHIDGPLGVKGRNSDNRLIKEKLDWAPSQPLKTGLELTYKWITQQIKSPMPTSRR